MRLQDWSARLDGMGLTGVQTRDIPWHITLESFAPEDLEQVTARVKKAAQETEPIDLTFNHLGIFSGGRVLFAAPDGSHELLDLREHFGDSWNWTAHATILIDEWERTAQALQAVLEDFKPFTGRIDSLHLYEFFPSRHILSLRLGENNDDCTV